MSSDEVLEADRLLASRPAREGTSGRKEFLVKWAGYDSPSDRTWEPRSNLGSAATARKLVKDLQQRQEATRSTPPPPPDQTAKRRKPPGAGRPRRRPCGATAKKADVATVAAAGGGKSAYEVAREQKIAANEAMLRQLGLIGASSPTVSLRHAAAAGARSNQPSSSRRPRAARQPRSPTELRRSARSHAASAAQRGAAAAAATGEDSCGSVPRAGVGGQRRIVLAPVDAAALDAAGRTASAVEGATFTKVMTRSMVEYSYKFGIGSAGAAVLPTYGSSPGGSRKMIVWMVADTESFGAAAQGGEGMYWPCVYHDHSKNFDGGWMGFAKAHSLRTSDVCVFERLQDRFEPKMSAGRFSAEDLQQGWVVLRVVLHRSGSQQ